MKRSTAILLGASGVILVGAWLGRSQPQAETDAQIFANVTECINSGVLTRETCETEFAAAKEAHNTRAPRFTERGQCESQYGSGSCQPATIAGTSYFIPAMVGALVASQLANRGQSQSLLPPLMGQQQRCAPGQTPQTQPGCVMPGGSNTGSSGGRMFSTSSGYALSRTSAASPTVRLPSEVVTRPPPRTTVGPVVSRSPSSLGGSATSSSVTRGGFGSTARSTSVSSSS